MQNQQQQQQPPPPPVPAPTASDCGPNTARQSTNNNNDANHLLSHSLKRLSLQTAANTPLPQSPGLNSPRNHRDAHRVPSSPAPPSSNNSNHNHNASPSVRRSSSVVSLNRASSPALGRKSSSSSLRGDVPGTPKASVSRRSSFNPNMPSPMGPKSPLHPPPAEEKPPLRACDVAEEHFKKELAMHEAMTGAAGAGTVVIVHDQCYGHRFSRPKVSKSNLSMIVERPERILASVLGISAAYVRLGGRHSEGSHPPHPHHSPPERIPFAIRKTSRVVDITSQVVTNVHGTKWMEELQSLCTSAERKLASNGKELVRDAPSIPGQPPRQELHAGDLYLCPESLAAFQGALGGVLDGVDAVFQSSGPSRAFVCIRPPGHHCSADFPSGFCWLNNVHVGIEHAMMNYGVTHAAIIDFDLHHGDGSQTITWARNKKVQNMSKNTANWKKTSVGYFSLHDINSYPCEDGDDDKVQAASLCIDNAHGQSIWNVHLETYRTQEEFWQIYEDKYMVLLDKARQYLKFHTNRLRSLPNHPAPKAAIFLSAGFDASEHEGAGMQRHAVNVPTEFYARFTRDVVRLAEEEGTGVDGRVISVLEGGYSDRALSSGVLSHVSGLCDGQVFSDHKSSKGLSLNMRQRLGALDMGDRDVPLQSTEEPEPTPVSYDPSWCHASNLTDLETLVNPPPPVVQKKPRTGPSAHFSSPTQSFTAKVVDPTKLHRTVSGKYPSASPSRAPTPPPPDVDWATAAHALSKLIIPSGRQTRSHKSEELAGPKVKREKPAPAPALSTAHADPSGRQLRGRKPATSYVDPSSDDEKTSTRPESRSSRRRTIADFQLASTEAPAPSRSASRRMSIASSVSSVGDSAPRSSRAPSRGPTPAPNATGNGVPVKKARGTTSNSAASSRIPKDRPPMPRVPSNYASKTTVAKENKVKEKENDVDQLTSGLKRITLKMPSKEEYEAREKQKEAEKKTASKTTATTTTRKAPAARTTKPSTKTVASKGGTGTKRGPGRPPKSSKPSSPVEGTKAATPALPPVLLAESASVPLEQPQPVAAEQPSSVLEKPATEYRPPPPTHAHSQPPQREQSPGMAPAVPMPERSFSAEALEPPTGLADMNITLDQLPKPSFVTAVEPMTLPTPPRPDTPPPPPPSSIPDVVSHNAHKFTAAPLANQSGDQMQAHYAAETMHWKPPNSQAPPNTASEPPSAPAATTAARPMSPASKRGDLPVFSANSTIPFAPNPNAANSAGNMNESKGVAEQKDIWEVPDTPAH